MQPAGVRNKHFNDLDDHIRELRDDFAHGGEYARPRPAHVDLLLSSNTTPSVVTIRMV